MKQNAHRRGGKQAAAAKSPGLKQLPSPQADPQKPVARRAAAGAPAATSVVAAKPGRLQPAVAGRKAFATIVELDPRITAGRMRDRYDVALTGLASADKPIESISLAVDGDVTALALYPPTTRTQQVFHLNLARRVGPDEAGCSFEIITRTRSGEESTTGFAIAADPEMHVSEGGTRELSAEATRLVPVVLYVEIAAVGADNVLRVSGWCVVRTQILSVQVLTGQDQLGQDQLGVAEVGQPREDIAAVYPGYANAGMSGFSMQRALPPGKIPASIAVQAVALCGSVSRVVVPVEVGASFPVPTAPTVVSPPQDRANPVSDPRRTIFVYCDVANLSGDGTLLVSGWAVCALGIAQIAVALDGEAVGDAELGFPRPDVAAEHPRIVQARHAGFLFQTQVSPRASGIHLVRIVARNGLDDVRELTIEASAAGAGSSAAASDSQPVLSDDYFRFQIDGPTIINGAVPHSISGRLLIEGWALARSGVEQIEVLLDGTSAGRAYHGTARRDVELAFPNWTDSLRSGFIFHCPPNALADGPHIVQLVLRAKTGRTFSHQFTIEVQKEQAAEDYATIRRRLSQAEVELYEDILGRLKSRASFQLLLCQTMGASAERLALTLQSLAAQAVADWQLLVVADADVSALIRQIAEGLNVGGKIVLLPPGADLAAVIAPPAAGGLSLFGVIAPGDVLGADALAEVAVAYGLHPGTEFLYADEDRISPVSRSREPLFKPEWSPDLLLSTNYIGRAWFATAGLVIRAGVDCTEAAGSGRRLCGGAAMHRADARGFGGCRRYWLLATMTVGPGEGQRQVLQDAASRRGIAAEVLPGCVDGTWRVKRTAPAKGKVSIIIPTCAAKGYVATCLQDAAGRTRRIATSRSSASTIFRLTCRNGRSASGRVRTRSWISRERSTGRGSTTRRSSRPTGEYLLFLNDDIEMQRKDWLDALLEHAQRPEVGIVGPQLLYPDRKVQHAGIFLTTLGAGRHSFRFLAEDDPGYFGLALTQRNVIAVTGACMLMRREVFDRLGRFDEAHEVVNNDVDCACGRGRRACRSSIRHTAQLIHHELASRAKIKDIYDSGHFAEQWRSVYAGGDPFFSPRLTKFADEYSPDTEPVRAICASRPLFRKACDRAHPGDEAGPYRRPDHRAARAAPPAAAFSGGADPSAGQRSRPGLSGG